MKKDYWDNVADSFEDEIFSVFHNDSSGLITGAIEKFGAKEKTASDIGCGIGSFLPAMSERFKSVFAADISPKVIERARDNCSALKNVTYRTADLSKPRVRLPKVDFCLCVNVILTPSLTHRIRMLDVICGHINPGGHLVLTVPSLESAMLTHARRAEWNVKDGISPGRALRAGFTTMTADEGHRMRAGIVDVDSVPHKHYLKEEISHSLAERRMKVLECRKITYPWSSEFQEPPAWMQAPYPWDWMIAATKYC